MRLTADPLLPVAFSTSLPSRLPVTAGASDAVAEGREGILGALPAVVIEPPP